MKMKFSKNMPENMRVETKEDVIRLIEEAIDNDDGTRYTIEEIRQQIAERYELAKARAKSKAKTKAATRA